MTDISSAESKVLAKLFDLDLFNDTSTVFGILPDALSQAYDERSYLGRISLFFNLKKSNQINDYSFYF